MRVYFPSHINVAYHTHAQSYQDSLTYQVENLLQDDDMSTKVG